MPGDDVKDPRSVVVWGNCQAEPIADLLRVPLARIGLQVEAVPPVFLATPADVERVRGLVARSAFLISQPIADVYRVPGCGTAQLAECLPPSGRLVTYPVTFHVGPFPYQVNARGADGLRVLAPVTDYHDLRALVAAGRGLSDSRAATWWPTPSEAAVRDISAGSVAELAHREAALDVGVSTLLDSAQALHTISHPRNAFLGRVAEKILSALGVETEQVAVPEREFLGARRAPLEPAVVAAHGWPAGEAHQNWVVNGVEVPLSDVLAAQLEFYRARPDVVADSLTRYAERIERLDL